jgi:toxin CcdB
MIQQFDVFKNPDTADAKSRPFLLVLQSDLVAGTGLKGTVVAPLVRRTRLIGAERLNPLVMIAGDEFWLATHELFALERRKLRGKVVSLAARRDDIIAAIDMLFTGI